MQSAPCKVQSAHCSEIWALDSWITLFEVHNLLQTSLVQTGHRWVNKTQKYRCFAASTCTIIRKKKDDKETDECSKVQNPWRDAYADPCKRTHALLKSTWAFYNACAASGVSLQRECFQRNSHIFLPSLAVNTWCGFQDDRRHTATAASCACAPRVYSVKIKVIELRHDDIII